MNSPSRQGTATLAVLIDADNAAPAIIEGLLAEVAKYGVAAVKRIYGDWTKPNLSGWKDCLLSHSIQPIQQFRYTVGKNATDSAMIIDAMDLLYTGRFDGFCLVSSDSDFTRLASRIREQGLTVYGFGERKTPKPFVTACDRFIYSDVLRAEAESDESSAPARRRSGGELRQDSRLVRLLQSAAQAVSDEEGWTTLGSMGTHIAKQAPEFDSRNYGYGKLSELVAATGLFDVETRNGGNNKTIWVRLKRRPRQGDEGRGQERANGSKGAHSAAARGQQAGEAQPGEADASGTDAGLWTADVAAPSEHAWRDGGEDGEFGGERRGQESLPPTDTDTDTDTDAGRLAGAAEQAAARTAAEGAETGGRSRRSRRGGRDRRNAAAQPAMDTGTQQDATQEGDAAPLPENRPATVAPDAEAADGSATADAAADAVRQSPAPADPAPAGRAAVPDADGQADMDTGGLANAGTSARAGRTRRSTRRPEVRLSETPWPIEASVLAPVPQAAVAQAAAEPSAEPAGSNDTPGAEQDPNSVPATPARKRRAPARKRAAKTTKAAE